MTKSLHLQFSAFLLLAWALPAWAYLDPGSGSLFLQLLLGGIAGAGVILKLYWHKFLGWFGKKPPDSADDSAADDSANH